jgi:hypothetical protein
MGLCDTSHQLTQYMYSMYSVYDSMMYSIQMREGIWAKNKQRHLPSSPHCANIFLWYFGRKLGV